MSQDKAPEKKSPTHPMRVEGLRLTERGNLGKIRDLLQRIKIAQDGETVEIQDMVKIGGQRPHFQDPDPPEPTNAAALKARSILSAQRDDLCREVVARYELDMEAYLGAIEEREQQRELIQQANPNLNENQIEAQLGPPPDAPQFVFPNMQVPDVTSEYGLAAKSNYELALKEVREKRKKLQKDEAMTISKIRHAMSKPYANEFELMHGVKEITENKDLVAYIDLLVTFHLTTKPGRPQEALDELRRNYENMSQGPHEHPTNWRERIEDQDHAMRIVERHLRDKRAREAHMSEEDIMNLPPHRRQDPRGARKKDH